jgi:uroporphyrinogen III methyltransferase/synthase
MNEPQTKVVDKPLDRRTIVVTRAQAQAVPFAEMLRNYGANIISCPTIEITDPESYALLDEAIENLFGYDWIIFTSVNGVEYFQKRLDYLGHDVSDLDDLRVCAIGEATAARLRDASVHVDVVPIKFKAEGVFEALQNFLGGPRQLQRLSFLIPRAAVARDYLPRALEEAGARVDVVPAYRTVKPGDSEKRTVEALLLGGAVDCVTFTSSSTVKNFAALFDSSDLKPLLDGVAVACIGDITSATALEFGLNCEIMPSEYTVTALAHAIAQYFSVH